MRRPSYTGNIILSVLITIFFNLEGLLPALVLFLFNRITGYPPMWTVLAALGIWILGLVLWTFLLSMGNKYADSGQTYQQNVNPHSVGAVDSEVRERTGKTGGLVNVNPYSNGINKSHTRADSGSNSTEKNI